MPVFTFSLRAYEHPIERLYVDLLTAKFLATIPLNHVMIDVGSKAMKMCDMLP